MASDQAKRSLGTWVIAAVAVVFGLLTIKTGGAVLFIGGEFRQQAGNYVPFVLWFNFLAGFVYLSEGRFSVKAAREAGTTILASWPLCPQAPPLSIGQRVKVKGSRDG